MMSDGLRILSVENVPTDFLLIERQLHRHDPQASCRQVATTVELDAALEGGGWDIVLLDYNVPGMDFRETLSKVCSRLLGVPVILVSGSVGEEAVAEIIRLGAWDFVLKNHLTRLAPVLERCLREVAERRVHQEVEVRLRLVSAAFNSAHEGIAITDSEGVVLAVNPAFTVITEYAESEAVGRKLSLLKSGRHDGNFYRRMWQTLAETGTWQGEIWNRRKSGEIYPEWLSVSAMLDSAGHATHYIGVLTDISRINHVETHLEHLAHHDVLTELPNRLLLVSRLKHSLERARRANGRMAVLFLDLDRFKAVNDTLGHQAGDELLRAVAARLRERLRDLDTLARLGGDEFVIVLDDLPGGSDDAAGVAQTLIDRLQIPFLLRGEEGESHEVNIGGSVGIALFPEDGDEVDLLLDRADLALYRAKESGRGRHCFYSGGATGQSSGTSAEVPAARLRRGLTEGEFVLHFQPMVTLADGCMHGVEALVRWQQTPDGPLLPPARFLPLAEETGFIIALGEWVLRTACASAKSWLDEGRKLDTLVVNLSLRQFRQADLPERIASILAETGLPPGCLELDIPEAAVLDQGGGTAARLSALRALGVRIAVDDFGFGCSSPAYFRRFPINRLKIHRDIVQTMLDDPVEQELVGAMLALARTMNLDMLAEGIETEAQREFMDRHGCVGGQGNFFGRPVSGGEFSNPLSGTGH